MLSQKYLLDSLEPRTLLSFGDLDPTFGNGGRGIVQFGQRSVDTVYATKAQPDGKIIVVGSTNAADGNGTDLAVARLNPDLTLDQSFGVTLANGPGGGLFELPLPTNTDNFFGVALQPDGKIVLVGSVGQIDPSTGALQYGQAVVIRLTSSGGPDPTFGTGVANGGTGFVLLPLSFNQYTGAPNSEARAVGLQSDGKIVIGGAADLYSATAFTPAASSFAVARLNPDGSTDTSFGEYGTGIEVAGEAGLFTAVLGLDVDRYDRIIFTGTAVSTTASPATGLFVVVRTNPNGIVDTSFGQQGLVTAYFAGSGSQNVLGIATSVVVQPDSKILVGGFVARQDAYGNAFSDLGLVRLLDNGSPDSSFGGSTGVPGLEEDYFIDPSTGGYEVLSSNQIRLTADGSFYLSGKAGANADGSVVARYTANGTLDTRFSDDGLIVLFPNYQPTSTQTLPFTADAITALATTGDATDMGTNAGAFVEQPAGGGILILATGTGGQLTAARLIPDGPDLITSTTGLKGGSYLGGAKGTTKVTFSNQGDAIFSGSVPIQLFLSIDGTQDDEIPITTTAPIGLAISPGASKTYSVKFVYPKGANVNGTYYVLATANDNGAVAEGNTVNNASVAATQVMVRPAFVEFALTLLPAPSTATVGKKATFSIQVNNTGSVPSKGKVTLQLFASTDDLFGDDTLLAGSKPINFSLKPGTKTLKLVGLVPKGLAPNTYTLLLSLDATGVADNNPVQKFSTGQSIAIS